MGTSNKLSRRTLLAGGAAAVVLAVAYPLVSRASEPAMFALASWTPLVGRQLQAGPAVVVLESVTDLRRDPKPGEHADPADRFRLGFSLVSGTFHSDTLAINHPGNGLVELFITHSGSNATAVIDRRGATLTPPVAKDRTHE